MFLCLYYVGQPPFCRPDLEPIIALGPKCGMDDPEAVLYLHNLCNRLGMDVISADSVAAFAMDLFAEGLLDLEKTDQIDLSWGNAVSSRGGDFCSVYNIPERCINIKFCPELLRDTISEKFLTHPVENGPAKGSTVK